MNNITKRVLARNHLIPGWFCGRQRLREQTALEKARQKEKAQRYKDDRKQEGIDRDTEAKAAIETLNNILNYTLRKTRDNHHIFIDKLLVIT